MLPQYQRDCAYGEHIVQYRARQREDDPGVSGGRRDDAAPMYHEAAYSEIHTSAIICGTCHNVTHLWYMTKLEGTYDEWYHSPYNSADPAKRVVCQDCHMRQAPESPPLA